MDVMDTAYLTKFDFAAANAPAMAAKLALAKHQQRGLAIDPAISRDTKCAFHWGILGLVGVHSILQPVGAAHRRKDDHLRRASARA